MYSHGGGHNANVRRTHSWNSQATNIYMQAKQTFCPRASELGTLTWSDGAELEAGGNRGRGVGVRARFSPRGLKESGKELGSTGNQSRFCLIHPGAHVLGHRAGETRSGSFLLDKERMTIPSSENLRMSEFVGIVGNRRGQGRRNWRYYYGMRFLDRKSTRKLPEGHVLSF